MKRDLLLRERVNLARGLMVGDKHCTAATLKEQDGATLLTIEQVTGGDILQGLTLLSCIVEKLHTDDGQVVEGPFEVAVLKKLAGRDLERLLKASSELEARGRDGAGA